ncbi:MAG: FkbM family methyltransferase [Variovorax sp.]|nr:FkbM family methyltransferase [Variovorax sp.]
MLSIEQRLQHIGDLAKWGVVTYDFEGILERHYRRWVRPGATVVDIGAHAGRHLKPLLQCVGASGTAIGFEPIPSVFDNLRTQLEGSGAVLVNAALSDSIGTAEFVFAQGCPEESGLRQRVYNMPDRAQPTIIHVRVDTLDNYAREFGRLDFVKIDVEGGEIGCLKGAQETIARLRPLISVEYGFPSYSAYGHTKQTLFDLAASYGYVLYDIFLNRLAQQDDWLAACDALCWDYIMVPIEKEAEFVARMLQPPPDTFIEARLASEQETTARLRVANAELEARAKSLEERAKSQEERAATAERQLVVQTARADELANRNDALLNSTSWRVTAPLRLVSKIVR